MLKEYLSALANKFREKLNITEKINAQDFVQKIDEVYEAGQETILEQPASIKKEISDTAIVTIVDPLEVAHNIKIFLSKEDTTDFSNVQLYKIGANLWGGELVQGTFSVDTGALSSSITRVRSKDYVYLPQGHYTIQTVTGLKFVIYVYDRNGNYKKSESLTTWSANNKLSFSINENRKIKFGICFAAGGTIIPEDVDWIMLNYSYITTEYIPYSQQPIEVGADGEAILSITTGEDFSLIVKPEDTVISLSYNHTNSPLDEFWDSFQRHGTLTNYRNAFGGVGWNNENLKPKYVCRPITPSTTSTNAAYMFSYLCWEKDSVFDYAQIADKIDFSQCYNLSYTFSNAHIKNIDIDCSQAVNLNNTFTCGDWGQIYSIRLKVSENCTSYTNTFNYCSALTDLIFTEDSVIAGTINLKYSTLLNKKSIESVMSVLSDTASGKTLTLSLAAVNNAFETSVGAKDGSTSAEWTALVDAKTNWTITLANS